MFRDIPAFVGSPIRIGTLTLDLTSHGASIPVERLFAELTQKRIRRGVFKSVKELVATIYHYLDQRNRDPKPFVWTASVQTILEKVRRANEALEALH